MIKRQKIEQEIGKICAKALRRFVDNRRIANKAVQKALEKTENLGLLMIAIFQNKGTFAVLSAVYFCRQKEAGTQSTDAQQANSAVGGIPPLGWNHMPVEHVAIGRIAIPHQATTRLS